MKLTPRSHGYRFRRPYWSEGIYVDITNVKPPDDRGVRVYYGWDQRGLPTTGHALESEGDWIKMGSTKKLKCSK